jgi:hypothetical protein
MNNPLLANVLIIVTTIVAVWAPFRWKRSTIAQQFIIVFVVELFITVIVEHILAYFHQHNLWLISLSTLIEFVLTVIIFYHSKNKKQQKVIVFMIGTCYFIFWVISKFTFEPISIFNSYTSIVARLLQIFMAISILFDILKDSNISLKHDYRIWFASGIIIYSAGSFMLCIFFMDLAKLPIELFKTVWHINMALNIVSELLYARAIWCQMPLAYLRSKSG